MLAGAMPPFKPAIPFPQRVRKRNSKVTEIGRRKDAQVTDFGRRKGAEWVTDFGRFSYPASLWGKGGWWIGSEPRVG